MFIVTEYAALNTFWAPFNPYKPTVLVLEQTLSRRRKTRRLIRVFTVRLKNVYENLNSNTR